MRSRIFDLLERHQTHGFFVCVCVCVLAFALSLFCYACAGQLTNNKHTQKKRGTARPLCNRNQSAGGRTGVREKCASARRPLWHNQTANCIQLYSIFSANHNNSSDAANFARLHKCRIQTPMHTHTHTQRGRWVTGAVGDRLGEEEDKKTRRKRTQMQRTK